MLRNVAPSQENVRFIGHRFTSVTANRTPAVKHCDAQVRGVCVFRGVGSSRGSCGFLGGSCAWNGGSPSAVFVAVNRGIGGVGTTVLSGDEQRDVRTSRDIDTACLNCAFAQPGDDACWCLSSGFGL